MHQYSIIINNFMESRNMKSGTFVKSYILAVKLKTIIAVFY